MRRLGARGQQAAVAAAVLTLGLATLAGGWLMPQPMGSGGVGPGAAPMGVGAVLTACGALLGLEVMRGGWPCEADDEHPDLFPMLILGAGMLANVLLIKTTGFIIATTVMFVFTARAFGARRWYVAAGIGFLLALATYCGFARLLDLRIGGGWIEDLI